MTLTTETSQITEINLSAAEIDEKRSGGNEMHSGGKRRPGVTPVGNCARLCSTANPKYFSYTLPCIALKNELLVL